MAGDITVVPEVNDYMHEPTVVTRQYTIVFSESAGTSHCPLR